MFLAASLVGRVGDSVYRKVVAKSMLMPIFDQFRFYFVFSGVAKKSAVIAILKTPAGSISFNPWLRCYRIV